MKDLEDISCSFHLAGNCRHCGALARQQEYSSLFGMRSVRQNGFLQSGPSPSSSVHLVGVDITHVIPRPFPPPVFNHFAVCKRQWVKAWQVFGNEVKPSARVLLSSAPGSLGF